VIQDLVQPPHGGIGVDRRPIAMARDLGVRVEQSLGDDLDIPHRHLRYLTTTHIRP
jgi:hypothetical protein